jgi:ribosome recycling factor
MVFFLLEKCVLISIAESVQILAFSWVLVTGSDYDRDEALESVVPSAKETATELMEAAMDALAKDLAKLRTGRASPGMLDHVTVESHGVRVPLPHVAAVSMPNLETLTVMPYDPSVSLPLPNSLGSLC